jgi:TolA-binding protein
LRQGLALLIVGFSAGCATAQPVTPDPQIVALLRTLATKQQDLERKVDKLESRLDAQRLQHAAAVAATAPAVAGSSADASRIPRDLATVKLSAQGKKAPALPTQVALQEPDEKTMDVLLSERAPVAKGDLDAQYAAAREAIRTGEPERGAKALERFAEQHPRDSRAPAALYEAGIGLMTSGDPQSAVLLFERLADDYPLAEQTPDAMLKTADCHSRLKRLAQVKETLSKVVSRYPGTPAAKAAEAGLKGLADRPAAQ